MRPDTKTVNSPVSTTINHISKGLHDITGSSLFSGGGLSNFRYEQGKGYYVNIDLPLRPNRMQYARNEFYNFAEKIKKSPLKEFISDKYSPLYFKDISNEFARDFGNILNIINELGQNIKLTSKSTPFRNLSLDTLKSVQQKMIASTTPLTISKNYMEYVTPKINEIIKAISDRINGHVYTVSQKGFAISSIRNIEDSMEKWKKFFTDDINNLEGVMEEEDNFLETAPFLNLRDFKIFPDQWEYFVDIVSNALIGVDLQRYSSHTTANDILLGRVGLRRRITTREISLKRDIKTISPETSKKFHEKIMVSIFLKSKKVIYLTTEQWESMNKGSRIYKAITGAGRELFSASKGLPNVSV